MRSEDWGTGPASVIGGTPNLLLKAARWEVGLLEPVMNFELTVEQNR